MKNSDKIIQCLKNIFENQEIDINSSAENLKEWDSVAMINIVLEIENQFKVKINANDITNLKSYKSIKKILSNKGIKF
ncbi:acyl carrier protein [Pelagibacteraceae bacterium]|nr:acyl carrier protein [Pelagibacteraceae bacterium]